MPSDCPSILLLSPLSIKYLHPLDFCFPLPYTFCPLSCSLYAFHSCCPFNCIPLISKETGTLWSCCGPSPARRENRCPLYRARNFWTLKNPKTCLSRFNVLWLAFPCHPCVLTEYKRLKFSIDSWGQAQHCQLQWVITLFHLLESSINLNLYSTFPAGPAPVPTTA